MISLKVHIVIGSTGEYSDHKEWLVAAYLDEERAKKHVLEASAYAREVFAKYGEGNYLDWFDLSPEERTKSNPLDPGMDMDYTGINYHYETTNLIN